MLAWGVRPGTVRQLDRWQGIEAGGLRLTATPARRFSGRRLHDGNRTLWSSIGRRYGPFDLTMLESGAYYEPFERATEYGVRVSHADDGRTDRSASTACRPALVARSRR